MMVIVSSLPKSGSYFPLFLKIAISDMMGIFKMNVIKPVFIFSLPRSGSTLLQRMLMVDERISSASEPWLLIPFIYALRRNGIYTEYWQKTSVQALEDFIQVLPNGKEDFDTSLREFAMSLYTKAADEKSEYFLDKTPRYHLIVDEIINLFPDAKFIFLWRNPLAIISSIISSFNSGKWNLHYYKLDLFTGLPNLINAFRNHQDKVLSVHYEALVESPSEQLARIFTYLNIESSIEMCQEKFSKVCLEGRMGDPTGVTDYSSLSTEPLEKWSRVLCNPVRKEWCKNYLDIIGPDNFHTIGYDVAMLKQQLASGDSNCRYLFSDVGRIIYGSVLPFVNPRSFKEKISLLPKFSKIYPLY